jgi:hypothetical protein
MKGWLAWWWSGTIEGKARAPTAAAGRLRQKRAHLPNFSPRTPHDTSLSPTSPRHTTTPPTKSRATLPHLFSIPDLTHPYSPEPQGR